MPEKKKVNKQGFEVTCALSCRPKKYLSKRKLTGQRVATTVARRCGRGLVVRLPLYIRRWPRSAFGLLLARGLTILG